MLKYSKISNFLIQVEHTEHCFMKYCWLFRGIFVQNKHSAIPLILLKFA